MESLQFSEEEQRATLRRAQEIAETRVEDPVSGDHLQAYLNAAEEAGIPRTAVLAALQERFIVSADSLKEGDMAFAPSADGACYPARIDRINSNDATVTFVNGGEHSVALSSLRPLGLVPGRELQYKEKDWGWVNAKVLAFDSDQQRVKVYAFLEEKWAPIKHLRIGPVKEKKARRLSSVLAWTAVMSGSIGTVLGFLLGHFLR
jgi:hypothetical protein